MKENDTRNVWLLCLAAALPELLLAPESGCTAREVILYGGIRAAVTAGVLAAACVLAAGWRNSPLFCGLLAVWLIACGADTLADLWGFYKMAYPRQLPGAAFMALCICTAAWQATGGSRVLGTAAKVQLAVFAAAVGLMIVSAAGAFHLSSLSFGGAEGIPAGIFRPAPMLPPYLIFCLLRQPGRPRRAAALPFCFWGWSILCTLTAELILGESGGRGWSIYRAALLGRLSIFNRLEWIQIMVWLLLSFGRLALYLYVIRLCLPDGMILWAAGVTFAAGLALAHCGAGGTELWQQAAAWAVTAVILSKGLWEWEKVQKCWLRH